MKWTSLNDLRESYLSFFESKGHLRLKSFPLVPQGDKSLLLINSGMAPMKKFFTGEQTPPCRRVTTCQKCIRTPDLERVGHTARHGTFFEMLGNFSFGDYFKREAIHWAWEFLTSPDWLAIPAERLWPSVYEGDDEAFRLWNEEIGIPAERITRLGKEDNFWEHGSGPCGPCSEIYFDRGEKYGCGSPDCRPGCDCDRFMEIWNNVFSQFNNDGHGNYTELIQKNIDTGMGLERLACVMQGVDNMFEVDTIRHILDTVCAIAGKTYGADAKDDISIRVVTDHIRSATFMIADGVVPSNEGRGYVLRRILRRACRHGRLLGIRRRFLPELCLVAIGESCGAYPELRAKQDYITKVIELEEERFDATVEDGLSMLNTLIDRTRKAGADTLPGDEVFKLYDTYGFPFDLTREIVEEAGLKVDEEAFHTLMEQQRARARAARGNISGWSGEDRSQLAALPATDFCGYDAAETEAQVLAIFTEEGRVDEIGEGDCTVVLDRTVCYGESGGQVGDTGTIAGENGTLTVSDTKKAEGVFLHIASVSNGTIRQGDRVTVRFDTVRRDAIRRNHSACHLLQAALRTVLGAHVEQAGSYVDEHRVRFDFSHYAAMTAEETARVENLVNREILTAEAVNTVLTDPETAKAHGAMALFGEKYGDVVRMVQMGDFSTELCGGTHVSNTGCIGLFKILSESSVAAGVRRIEGTTGTGVLDLIAEKDALINSTAKELKATNPHDLPRRAGAVTEELRSVRRALESANGKLTQAKTDALLQQVRTVGSYAVLTGKLSDMTTDEARALCDTLRGARADLVAVFSLVNGNRLNFVASCGPDAVKAGAHAGNILKAVSAVTGGKGGGRPEAAMSGGLDLNKIDEALALVDQLLTR